MYFYVTECRWRICYSLSSWAFLWLVCYRYQTSLLLIILKPFQIFEKPLPFIYLHASSLFLTVFSLAAVFSFLGLFLFMLYQLRLFTWTSFYHYEREIWVNSISLILFFWFGGLLFLVWVVGPSILCFFISYQHQLNELDFVITMYLNLSTFLSSIYYTFVIFTFLTLAVVCGVVYGWNNPLQTVCLFSSKRRYAYIIALTIAAIITPPDVYMQLIGGGFLIIGWETLIFFICLRNVYKKSF